MASQLNAAILKAEHSESSQSQLAVSLRLSLWAQEELDRKRVRYPHMQVTRARQSQLVAVLTSCAQLATGHVEEPK